jgi:ABC-type dipeptide/oligopeptide/nickel transport system permease component
MKKIFILLLIVFTIISCTENDKWENVAEESVRIVDEYVDTLETSVGDARAVKELIEWGQNNLEKELNSIY